MLKYKIKIIIHCKIFEIHIFCENGVCIKIQSFLEHIFKHIL